MDMSSSVPAIDTASLATFVHLVKEISDLREERQTNQSTSLIINTSLITSMIEEVARTRKEIQEIVSMQWQGFLGNVQYIKLTKIVND